MNAMPDTSQAGRQAAVPAVDPLFLCATRVSTLWQGSVLTNASGFFFERGARLYLVTSRHVVLDESTQHRPDQLEIELHTDGHNLALSVGYSVPLYASSQPLWRQGRDAGGDIDVAVIELDRRQLPPGGVLRAFTAANLGTSFADVSACEPLAVVGFPLGFHDALHHLPGVRQAAMASSYGMRFGGEGYFLTDARTHRGMSGAPVVMPRRDGGHAATALPWRLLGVHSARLDVGHRDLVLDESLGLNCAWYADILLTLTEDAEVGSPTGWAT